MEKEKRFRMMGVFTRANLCLEKKMDRELRFGQINKNI